MRCCGCSWCIVPEAGEKRIVFKVSSKFLIGILMMLLPMAGGSSLGLAQEALSPRLQIGIGLLPAVIAANKDLGTQDSSRPLPIYLLYRDNPQIAEQLRRSLEQTIGVIRGRELAVRSISLEDLLTENPRSLSSVFIAEPLDNRLDEVIRFAEIHRLLLFSPFKGDVERGVAAGLKVTHKVLPMINMQALDRAKIELKAFFLRIAVKHE